MRRRAALLVVACGLVSVSSSAAGPKPVDCPTASEEGQRLRAQSKYRDARERFHTCAQASCPAVVRKDCAKWVAELDDTMPSVIVAAVDEHEADMREVEISVDGEMVSSRIDGTPIQVDPGPHELRATSSGRVPASQSVVIRVGEKNRIVRLKFAPKTGTTSSSSGSELELPTSRGAAAPVAPHRSYAPPPLSIGLGVIGGLALGAFAALGVTAKNDLAVLRSTCAPSCEDGQLSGIKTRMALADVSLAAGIVALGAGTVLWVLKVRKPLEPRAAQVSWQLGGTPLPNGAAASLVGRF